MKISQQPFGSTQDGQEVSQFTLENDAGMQVDVITYGGIIRRLLAPDSRGEPGDVVLGFDTLAEYLAGHPYFGALVGRYANRIRGASFELDGVRYQLAANIPPNHLHGGVIGFDKRVWQAEPFQAADRVGLILRYSSPDGEENYPGNLDVTVTYTLQQQNALDIDYHAVTDAPTVLNLTNHSYFNLAGQGTILEHEISIDSDLITPMAEDLIPTGEFMNVAGTPFDLRGPTRIGAQIDADHEQIRRGGGYDHNFVLNGSPGELRPAARVLEPGSQRLLEVLTTQPGVQFYAGNMMPEAMRGKGGRIYPRRGGLCLETQHFPDSPNQPHFPSTVLRPGEVFHERTVFRLDVA